VFTVEERDRAQARVRALAAEDARVVDGKVVGSLALGGGDRWSDLDLTFAVADGIPVHEVLADWTVTIERELAGVQLFDLPAGPSIYRVFLLPGSLQFDVSFTPAAQFDAPRPGPPDPRELFGYGVHHAVRARISIERGRLWLAEYWVSGVRDYALSLACVRRGLPARHGRGIDDLPAEVLASFEETLVQMFERNELLRALRVAVDGLMREGAELAEPVERDVRMLVEAANLS
jgi:hypothetical protein